MSQPAFHPLDTIIRKRDGQELTREEIGLLVRAIVRSGEARLHEETAALPPAEKITDAQIGSLLMAIFQRGLNPRELADLTSAMRFSGETFSVASLQASAAPALPPSSASRAPFVPPFLVDKHSTGGVGDKTSLLIAPILAAAGLRHPHPDGTPSLAVPMISGRSLGHTGGTLDKLETIPGFNTQLPLSRMAEVLRECGAALVGQTPRLVPADRILYALRDHTGTVESPFLITASIMSKKLAEDLRGLVLDVKVGSGAFMPTLAASRQLAELMVATGESAGTRTVALLTTMDEPLGRFSGNWLEVWECVDILRAGPDQDLRHPLSGDLIALSNILAGWMLHLAGAAPTPEAGAQLSDELLQNGEAWQAWLRIVAAQGGDLGVFADQAAFHAPRASRVLRAPRSGYLAAMNCKQVGWAVQRLGAGRTRPGEPVSAHAGLEAHAKLGDHVQKDAPLFTLYSEDETLLAEPFEMLRETVRLDPAPHIRKPLVQEVILASGQQ